MRILYVSKLAPQLGMRRIHEVAKRFVAWGHEVTVLSAATTSEQPPAETVDGIRIIALSTAPRSLRRNDRIGFLLTRMPFYIAAPRFVRSGKAGHIDIVVEDVAPLRSPGLGAVTAKLGIPLVLQVHSVFPTVTDWVRAYGPKGVFGILSERWLRHGRDYQGLYSDAPWTVRSLGPSIGDRLPMRWIPNGVDVQRFRPPPSTSRFDSELRLLAVGRLVGLKNLDTLIRAVGELGEGVHLTVVGDGPLRPQLAALTRRLGLDGRVVLAGRVSEEDLVHAYQGADVFVHPSLVEGMPLSVLEAMASGLPVVMNDIEAARAIVRPEFGWLTRSTDVAGWTASLADLVQVDRDTLRERGMRARTVSEADFSWDTTARHEFDFLQGIVARGQRIGD